MANELAGGNAKHENISHISEESKELLKPSVEARSKSIKRKDKERSVEDMITHGISLKVATPH